MSIDFDNAGNMTAYLAEKLDDLLDGINESYGKALLDELIARLEQTVIEFNEEVNELMDQLKANMEKKERLLEQIRSGVLNEPVKVEAETGSASEMSEWEKRLESMEKS